MCREEGIKFDTDAAAIAISVYTQTAPASYRISCRMRQLGKLVILGGPHFRSSSCKEALPYCDVVVSTISREQWISLLCDIKAGRLEPGRPVAQIIRDDHNRFEYPQTFYETFKSQKWFQIPSVPTSIGCPYDCSFCSAYLQGRYKVRDLDTIHKELSYTNRRLVFLCDATFGLNKQFTMALMKRIGPLKKKILIETALARLRDRELLDALADGGIKWVSVGIESLSTKLGKHGGGNLCDSVHRAIDDLHAHGILVQGNFICGLDSDGPESFEQIYDFYRRSDLDLVIVDLLTPYPNTAQYDALVAEGRIIDNNWEHYDYRHVVYRPRQMRPEQLIDGFLELYRRITRPFFVLRKATQLYGRSEMNLEAMLMMSYNVFGRLDARRKERDLLQNRARVVAGDSWLETSHPGENVATMSPLVRVSPADTKTFEEGPHFRIGA